MRKTEYLLFWMLVAVVVPLECVCARLAHETLGAITSGMYFLAIALNFPLLLLSFKSRRWAAVGIFILGMLIIPYQLYLGNRLLRIQAEAAQIVAYLYEAHSTTGIFPADLKGYTFRDPAMRSFVQGYTVRDVHADFQLVYRVGTEQTSHWYSPKSGWTYYDD